MKIYESGVSTPVEFWDDAAPASPLGNYFIRRDLFEDQSANVAERMRDRLTIREMDLATIDDRDWNFYPCYEFSQQINMQDYTTL